MIEFNNKDWPFILIQFDNNTINDNIFDEYITNLFKLYDMAKSKNERITLIFDLSKVSNVPMKYVLKQGTINKKLNPLSKLYINETYFLTSSKFMKHILNLLFTIEKPTRPYKVFSNINKLKIHLEKKCEESNINETSTVFLNKHN